MKFGFRKPSIKKSIKARTTGKLKRSIRSSVDPTYGKKGMGVIKNPKKAVYNKVYNKTSFSIWDLFKSKKKVKEDSIRELEKQSAMTQVENHIKIIQESSKILNATKNPETFFTRFDLLLDHIDKIIDLTNQYEGIEFTGEQPKEERQRLNNEKSEHTNFFIKNYYKSVHDKIVSLKTDKAKLNNANKFKNTLLDNYSHHLSSENIELINNLYDEALEEFNLN